MTDGAPDLQRLAALAIPGLGLAAMAACSPSVRLHLEQQHAEQHYFGKCLALGLTLDDARMVLDREEALAAKHRFTRAELWERAWDQAIRHCSREPYRPFPDRADYLQNLIKQASTPDPA